MYIDLFRHRLHAARSQGAFHCRDFGNCEREELVVGGMGRRVDGGTHSLQQVRDAKQDVIRSVSGFHVFFAGLPSPTSRCSRTPGTTCGSGEAEAERTSWRTKAIKYVTH